MEVPRYWRLQKARYSLSGHNTDGIPTLEGRPPAGNPPVETVVSIPEKQTYPSGTLPNKILVYQAN